MLQTTLCSEQAAEMQVNHALDSSPRPAAIFGAAGVARNARTITLIKKQRIGIYDHGTFHLGFKSGQTQLPVDFI